MSHNNNSNNSNNDDDERNAKVIIFDWDDTICPSSYFDRQQIERADELPVRIRVVLNEIAKCAALCLAEASKYGEVIIITNSDDGWVRYSCERIVPSLLPTLDKYKIVSARTRYERFYPGQPLCWKAAAFAHEASESLQQTLSLSQQQRQPQSSRNDASVDTDVDDSRSNENKPPTCPPSLEDSDVSSEEDSAAEDIIDVLSLMKSEIISFGDSMEERAAVRIVSDQLDTTPKSVMFVQSPNPYQIVGQLRLLTKHMDYVCRTGSMLDLEITLGQAIDSAKVYFHEIGAPNLATDELVSEVSKAASLRSNHNDALDASANTTHPCLVNEHVEESMVQEQRDGDGNDDPMQEDDA